MKLFTLIGLAGTTLKFSLDVEAETIEDAAKKLRGVLVESPAMRLDIALTAAKLFVGRPHRMFDHGLATSIAIATVAKDGDQIMAQKTERLLRECSHCFLGEAQAS
jgi:hypothetical protein